MPRLSCRFRGDREWRELAALELVVIDPYSIRYLTMSYAQK